MRVLRMLWALPNTLVGLVLGLLSFARPRWDGRGALIFASQRGLCKLLYQWRYIAITFGHVVITRPDPSEKTLRHEFAHVRQYETWGPFFTLVYAFYCVKLRLEGKNPYHANPFEIEAKRVEEKSSGLF